MIWPTTRRLHSGSAIRCRLISRCWIRRGSTREFPASERETSEVASSRLLRLPSTELERRACPALPIAPREITHLLEHPLGPFAFRRSKRKLGRVRRVWIAQDSRKPRGLDRCQRRGRLV